MTHPLAIYSPTVGARSETFIRRHVQELLAQRTVVITSRSDGPDAAEWTRGIPTLDLGATCLPRAPRLVQRIARRLGLMRAREEGAIGDFLRANHVEVMLAEYLDASVHIAPHARRLGLRFVAHGHGYDVSHRLRDVAWREAYCELAAYARIVVPCGFLRDKLVAIGIAAAGVVVVPYGVDLPATARAHREVAMPRVLAVGRLVPKKGPLLLLDAFRRAHRACGGILTLDYVGGGRMQEDVERYVAQHRLERAVRLHGPLPSSGVMALMREADIFAQHSITDAGTGDTEGLPVAILEAMAHGLPIVSTLHAGIPEAVNESYEGFLVEEGDSASMAARLTQLAADPGLRASMGEHARQRAARDFSWNAVHPRLMDVLGLASLLT